MTTPPLPALSHPTSPSLHPEPHTAQKPIDTIPGPVRMLLVDTNVFVGAIAEIPLDGNTLLTGTNAAGKTSIIQLIPLFYGQSPTKISNKTQGQDFYHHYLPRSTSYIAFEYRHRDGGHRSVIIYAAPHEDKPMFRFVRSPLYKDMFIDDNGAFVASKSLAQHLRKRGYEIADRVLDTLSDYQSVIQGLPIQKNQQTDGRFFAQITTNYSATHPRQPLLHMERVVFAMLKKTFSLQALEEMIADKILQTETDLQVQVDRKKLEDWPSRYQAYLDVMAEEETVRALNRDCIELQGHQAFASEAIGELLGLRQHAEKEKTTATALRKRTESTLDIERHAYNEAKAAAHEKTSDAAFAKRNIQTAIDHIKKQEASFQTRNIEKAVALASQKPDLEAEIREIRARIDALTGSQDKLIRVYNERKLEIHAYTEEQRRIARHLLEECRQETTQQKHNILTRHREEMEELRSRHANAIKQAELVLNDALSELGAARQATRQTPIPPDLLERRERIQQHISNVKDQINAALKTENTLTADVAQAKQTYAEIETAISRSETHKTHLIERKHTLEASKKPSTGTLLAYLRHHRPNWGDDIGRVLHPNLLHRTDLHPHMLSNNNGIFGIDIDLSNLEPLAEADISKIDAEIDTLIADIADTEEQIATHHKNKAEAAARLAKARSNLQNHQANLRILENKKTALENDLRSVDIEISQAQAETKARAEAALSNSELTLQKAQSALDTARQAEIEERHRLQASHAKELLDIDQRLQAGIDAYKAREAELEAKQHARISTINAELQKALAQEGIDPQTIADLQARAASIQTDLERINANAELVEAWKHFLKTEHSKLPQLQTELLKADQAYAAAEHAEQTLKDQWMIRQHQLENILHQHKTAEQTATAHIEKINKRLQGVDTSTIVASTTPLRSIDDNIHALNTAEAAIRKLTSSITIGVSRIATVFANKPGSPAEQHLSQWRKHTNQTIEGPHWVPMLIAWYDTLHHQHLETLMNDARLLVSSVSAAYQRLVALHSRIGLENRLFQASLNKNNVTPVVQDISVTISSTINQLEFMGPMERITQLHEQWQASGKILPPEGFTQAMENLLSFWHPGKGISANLRDHIRIEGYVVENGNRRTFHDRTDVSSISSTGISYLILTTILVGFINMVRGKQPIHVVWALDEISHIDAANTRALLDMLQANNITLIAATPSTSSWTSSLFDYRLKVIEGNRLADIRSTGRSSQRLTWSPNQTQPSHPNPPPNPDEQANSIAQPNTPSFPKKRDLLPHPSTVVSNSITPGAPTPNAP